jgi:4a-hydroxytetrahydrobiopterin dehydratase
MDGTSWEEVDYFSDGRDQKALIKLFSFKNFKEALKFVNKVGDLSEKAGHHPDVNLGWGYVKVWLTTHDAHGITEKDYELAKQIDLLLK